MDRYKVKQRLDAFNHNDGKEGCYLVEDSQTGQFHVMKLVDLSHLPLVDQLRLSNESLTLKQLKHKNLTRYKDVFVTNQPIALPPEDGVAASQTPLHLPLQSNSYFLYFVVDETLEQKRTLAQAIRKRRSSNKSGRISTNRIIFASSTRSPSWSAQLLSLESISLIFLQLLLAVDYLHRHKFVHRNIRTSNVYLYKNGKITLCHTDVFGQLFTRCSDSNVVQWNELSHA